MGCEELNELNFMYKTFNENLLSVIVVGTKKIVNKNISDELG